MKKKIVIIGNYKKDKQMSMLLYAQIFHQSYSEKGYQVELWNPICFFAYFIQNTYGSIGKWLSYLDKYLLFPLIILLRRMFFIGLKQNVTYHICDHSNAIYLPYLNKQSTFITCHDVLAIRGALGYKDAYCEASKFGVILQKWILKNLLSVPRIVAVSNTTKQQLIELANLFNKSAKDIKVIMCPFNGDFFIMNEDQRKEIVSKYKLSNQPFILHVGSSLPRKNRALLIDILDELKNDWDGHVCFVGEGIDLELQMKIDDLNLNKRVFCIEKPPHKDLVGFYNICEAFIFPSFSEGFGWPLIEAQKCGTPVIASNIQPMPEVSGEKAIHHDPNDKISFAKSFLKLETDKTFKNAIIEGGLKNCERFEVNKIVDEYLEYLKI